MSEDCGKGMGFGMSTLAAVHSLHPLSPTIGPLTVDQEAEGIMVRAQNPSWLADLHMSGHVVEAFVQMPVLPSLGHNPVQRVGQVQWHVWAGILVDRQGTAGMLEQEGKSGRWAAGMSQGKR